MSRSQDKFLTYYHRELAYLRNAGAVFSEQHPNIARRLALSPQGSTDPHVERLLESFAFLTARLSQNIDDRLPEVATALLTALYPHLVNPVPSFSIAQFVMDPAQGKLTSGFEIPRHAPLSTPTHDGITCRFRTTYPVTLWPIQLQNVDFVQGPLQSLGTDPTSARWFLRLTLKGQNIALRDLETQMLRWHIAGDKTLAFTIYDAIFAHNSRDVFVKYTQQGKEVVRRLPENSVRPAGFCRDETVLPQFSYGHPAYQYLHEYFHFVDKFLFFDVDNLSFKEVDEEIQILIAIDEQNLLGKMDVSPVNFRLGCTPIINLFSKITDPVRLDHKRLEYRLVPDQRRERTTEIYRIERVSSAVDTAPDSIDFTPYFGFNHENIAHTDTLFWYGRRVSSERKEIPGTDVVISFVDLDFNPHHPPTHTIYAHTLCTNRFLAEQIPAGGALQLEGKAPVAQIICLNKPTSQVYSASHGVNLWRLISHLSVNHVSLIDGKHALESLQKTLKLYAGTGHPFQNDVYAIEELHTRYVTRRLVGESWRGFVQGLQVTLTVNERACSGASVFLLGSVLRQFFALQASMNNFIELKMDSIQRRGEWVTWPPLRGDLALL